MKLGAFSVSLNVKDIHVSKAFYENLGFETAGGNIEQNWIILKNDQTVIGLFQGMFASNILTFNPGWDQSAQTLPEFTDIRELQKELLQKGVTLDSKADDSSTGPASMMLTDPDGNTILIDQHV